MISISISAIRDLITSTRFDLSSSLNILQIVSGSIEPNNLNEKELPYNLLFSPSGELLFKKDLQISIFDCLDKVMKNEKASMMSYKDLESSISSCELSDKILEGIYVNYTSYQYFDPLFAKTSELLNLMSFEDTAE